ncbi:hypothetical protein HYE68_003919 [Fusarium pseudograminearum]|nr:hypothetical protein HYE68_003919 [Fusarium pseudograminearum]
MWSDFGGFILRVHWGLRGCPTAKDIQPHDDCPSKKPLYMEHFLYARDRRLNPTPLQPDYRLPPSPVKAPNIAITIIREFMTIQQRLVETEDQATPKTLNAHSTDLNILLDGVKDISECSATKDGNRLETTIIDNLDGMNPDTQEFLALVKFIKDIYRRWEMQSEFRWRRRWPEVRRSMHQGEWWRRQDDTYHILVAVGQILSHLSLFSTAFALYEEAISGIDMLRRQTSPDHFRKDVNRNPTYKKLYFLAARTALKWHFCMNSSDGFSTPLKNAFASLERGMERSLLDNLHTNSQMGFLNPKSAISDYRRLSSALETRQRMLDQELLLDNPNVARVKQWEDEVRRLRIQVTDAANTGGPASLTDVARLQDVVDCIPEGTVILQYYYEDKAGLEAVNEDQGVGVSSTSENFFVWKISRAGISDISLFNVSIIELENKIRTYHSQCSSARALSRHLELSLVETLFPSALNLDDATNLIIIPCRDLWSLPFHALPHPRTGEQLMKAHSISYLPCVSAYIPLRARGLTSRNMNVLAIGNPSNMAHQDLQTGTRSLLLPLPGSELEAKLVGKHNSESLALTGSSATKTSILSTLDRYDILHIATHGEFSRQFPTMSSIAVADGQQISVEDLIGSNMAHELVILSACHTGELSHSGNNDLIGFAAALIFNGVKNVIVSLWPINDHITVIFMKRLYEEISLGSSISNALRNSRLAVYNSTIAGVDKELIGMRSIVDIKDREMERIMAKLPSQRPPEYKHPKFWAPFILIGADTKTDLLPTYREVDAEAETEHRHEPVYHWGNPYEIGIEWGQRVNRY